MVFRCFNIRNLFPLVIRCGMMFMEASFHTSDGDKKNRQLNATKLGVCQIALSRMINSMEPSIFNLLFFPFGRVISVSWALSLNGFKQPCLLLSEMKSRLCTSVSKSALMYEVLLWNTMSNEASLEQKLSTTTLSSVAVQAGNASIVIAVLKVRQQMLAHLFINSLLLSGCCFY